jgi:hypothetical protein
MTKKKKRRRSRGKPFSFLIGTGLGIAFSRPIQNLVDGNWEGALAEVGSRFTGYNFQSGVFDLRYAAVNGYAPIVLGAIGSKVATALGINREIKKIPYAGKYIKL